MLSLNKKLLLPAHSLKFGNGNHSKARTQQDVYDAVGTGVLTDHEVAKKLGVTKGSDEYGHMQAALREHPDLEQVDITTKGWGESVDGFMRRDENGNEDL